MRCSLCSSGPTNSRQKSWTNQIVFTLSGRCVIQVRPYHCIVYPRVHCAVQFSALGYTTPVCKILTVSSASSCSSWCHRWLLTLWVSWDSCSLSTLLQVRIQSCRALFGQDELNEGQTHSKLELPYQIRACIALSSRVPQGIQHLNLIRPPAPPFSPMHAHTYIVASTLPHFRFANVIATYNNLWCTFIAIAKQVIPCRSKITYNASS